jgi:hypothetical protein
MEPLIALSRLAQGVNSEQRGAQQDSQVSDTLASFYLTLNVRGVNACRTLDEGCALLEVRRESREKRACSSGYALGLQPWRQFWVPAPATPPPPTARMTPPTRGATSVADCMHHWRHDALQTTCALIEFVERM